MTTEPASEQETPTSATKPVDKDSIILEDLFSLGYTTSDYYTIYKDEDREIKVQFRTLVPHEIRAIANLVSYHESQVAQFITEQMETLARAIVRINGMPLTLSSQEQQEFYDKNQKQPSPLEMAHIILTEKIKSEYILNALFDAYQEFANGIFKRFEDIKKKLQQTPSSKSISPS